jgi:hypothetical protein
MVLDCPEAVDDVLEELNGSRDFLQSESYGSAADRYGSVMEKMSSSSVDAGTLGCVVTGGDPYCYVDSSTPSCYNPGF